MKNDARARKIRIVKLLIELRNRLLVEAATCQPQFLGLQKME